MSMFPQWMAAAAVAFNTWLESWVTRDYGAFYARSKELSEQLWPTIRGTMVRDPDRHDEPWLKGNMLAFVQLGVSWVGQVVCCRSSSSRYAPCLSW